MREAVAPVQLVRCQGHPDCYERTSPTGHFTGSAWLVSGDGQRVLLTHHRKLDRWLQLGGHADGSGDLAEVALREARGGIGDGRSGGGAGRVRPRSAFHPGAQGRARALALRRALRRARVRARNLRRQRGIARTGLAANRDIVADEQADESVRRMARNGSPANRGAASAAIAPGKHRG